jgi:hypothetical protein
MRIQKNNVNAVLGFQTLVFHITPFNYQDCEILFITQIDKNPFISRLDKSHYYLDRQNQNSFFTRIDKIFFISWIDKSLYHLDLKNPFIT